jgi:hypothetical protein
LFFPTPTGSIHATKQRKNAHTFRLLVLLLLPYSYTALIARGINFCLQAAYWRSFPGSAGGYFTIYFTIGPEFPLPPLFPEFRQPGIRVCLARWAWLRLKSCKEFSRSGGGRGAGGAWDSFRRCLGGEGRACVMLVCFLFM